MSVVGQNVRPSSVVGKSQLIFVLLVGNFFLVLSVELVSNIFSPFVASRSTPLTPSKDRKYTKKIRQTVFNDL